MAARQVEMASQDFGAADLEHITDKFQDLFVEILNIKSKLKKLFTCINCSSSRFNRTFIFQCQMGHVICTNCIHASPTCDEDLENEHRLFCSACGEYSDIVHNLFALEIRKLVNLN